MSWLDDLQDKAEDKLLEIANAATNAALNPQPAMTPVQPYAVGPVASFGLSTSTMVMIIGAGAVIFAALKLRK